MKILLILLLSSLIAYASAKSGKIVGGITAKQGVFPYNAALKTDTLKQICGGAIINSRWILSAAHCNLPNLSIIGYGHIILGKQRNCTIKTKVPHPLYNSVTGENDILLLQTNTDISFTSTSAYSASWIPLNTNLIMNSYPRVMNLTGWGVIHPESFIAPDVLIWLPYNLKTLMECSIENCASGSPKPFYFETQFCAKGVSMYQDEAGMCTGDDGGPLVFNGLLYGIASRFMNENDQCTTYPDIFVSVAYYISWINSVVQISG